MPKLLKTKSHFPYMISLSLLNYQGDHINYASVLKSCNSVFIGAAKEN